MSEAVAKTIICQNLLYECWDTGEFSNVSKLAVIGTDEDLEVITEFMRAVDNRIMVEKISKECICDCFDKFLITTENYREAVDQLKEKKVRLKKVLCLPFFDVIDSMGSVR